MFCTSISIDSSFKLLNKIQLHLGLAGPQAFLISAFVMEQEVHKSIV